MGEAAAARGKVPPPPPPPTELWGRDGYATAALDDRLLLEKEIVCGSPALPDADFVPAEEEVDSSSDDRS